METKQIAPIVHNSKHEPFKILETQKDGKKQFEIVIGNAILCEKKFEKKQDTEAYLSTKPYTLIINAACFCMEQAQKLKENEKK